MSLNLSKSRYCSAVQCPKMLWLKKNKPEEFDDSVMNQTVLANGNMVGDLAMGLFGDFTEVPFGDLTEMIAETARLMESGTAVIAEASFAYDGCFCSVDILKNLGGGRVELYEVKSSTSVHDIYLHDTAFQNFVLTKLGYKVERVCLVHINKEYVRRGELSLSGLFSVNDLTQTAQDMLGEVEQRIAFLRSYMEQENEPCDGIGEHCFSPYDCGFWGYCTAGLPKPNVFDIPGMMRKTQFNQYELGNITFAQVEKNAKLSAGAKLFLDHELNDLPDVAEKAEISAFLGRLSYPLYFLDFESFQPPVPLYDESRPYQQIVFQYSLHYIEYEGGELKHKEFLAYPGADPRRALAEQLCRDIPRDVCTTAYNMSFEKTRIKELAELYPDLAEHLMNIHDNIYDLMEPFRKKQYYNRAMKGSYSIKYVLPALFPDDPSLDYHSLEGVHNGAEASAEFAAMAQMSAEELEQSRQNLLKYCGLDTFAMVKVWEKLREVCGG